VAHRGLDGSGQVEHLLASLAHPGADEEHHLLGAVQQLGEPLHLLGRRHLDRLGVREGERGGGVRSRPVAGQREHGHATEPHGGLHGDPEHARQMVGAVDHFAEVAAVDEDPVRVGLLEVSGADLARRDVGSQRQHRRGAAVGVVQTLDEVGVAGPAAARADRQPAGRPVTCASAEAANAAASSLWTWIHLKSRCRRIASVIGLRLSPTMP
jgi:hypothetical protein